MRLLLLCVLLLPTWLEAGWQRLVQFDRNIGSGFFFNEQHGLIGSGSYALTFNSSAKIWRTTDGGTTWQSCLVPSTTNARVTSIFMVDTIIGYASISDEDFAAQSLWKTTNGGISWFNHTQGNSAEANCVYATPYALVITSWTDIGGQPGGFSLDDGRSWNHRFVSASSQTEYNGIDFIDDRNGVVTTGPTNGGSRPCFYTVDGGRSWSEGGSIPETWGVYALKKSNLFIILSEGRNSSPSRTVRVSTDVGRSWSIRYPFPGSVQFTGHIAGKNGAVYVQTSDAIRQGLFRSDDFGFTWKAVGGPSNERDTRFVVTGCNGETVYAFDDNGWVWKTTDGGDGTLSGGSTDVTLTFKSLDLTTVCTKVRDWVPITFGGCSESVTIDALTIEDDLTFQFRIDTLSTNLISINPNVVRIPIEYTPQSPGVQIVKLRIRAHTSGMSIDTTITITGRTVKLPAPYVPDIARASAGDTVLIPIYLEPTSDPFSISDYEVYLRFNTDLLEAFGIDSGGTLTRMIRSSSFSPQPDGLKCRFALWRAITESSELAQPLVVIKAHVYLTSEASTTVTLDSFHTISGVTRMLLLGCDPRTSSFTINLHCGDSSLLLFMKTGEVRIASIRPNPNAGDAFKVDISMPARGDGVLEAVNSLGIASSRTYAGQLAEGMSTVTFRTEELAAGLYYLQLTTPYGIVRSRPVIIAR